MGNSTTKQIDAVELETKFNVALQKSQEDMAKLVQDTLVKFEEGLAEIKQMIEQNNKAVNGKFEEHKGVIQDQNEALLAKLLERHESLKIMIESIKTKPKPRGFYDEPEYD